MTPEARQEKLFQGPREKQLWKVRPQRKMAARLVLAGCFFVQSLLTRDIRPYLLTDNVYYAESYPTKRDACRALAKRIWKNSMDSIYMRPEIVWIWIVYI